MESNGAAERTPIKNKAVYKREKNSVGTIKQGQGRVKRAHAY